MEKFALKVEFSALGNSVLYGKAMTLIDPQWPNVAFLENRLKKNFHINFEIGFKSEDGFYISPDEPVEILKYVEMLIAFKRNDLSDVQPEISCEKATSKPSTRKPQSQPENGPEILATADFVSKKKRKHRSIISFTTSTPSANVAKRLKGLKEREEDSQTSSKGLITSEEKEVDMQNELSPVEFNNSAGKRNKNNSLAVSPNKVPSDVLKERSNGGFNVNNSKQHVFFDESGSKANSKLEENNEEQTPKIEIVFLCELDTPNQKTSRGRFFEINKKQNKKNTIENGNLSKQAAITENLSNHISIVENITLAKPQSQNNAEHIVTKYSADLVEETDTTVDLLRDESNLEQSTKPSECLESLVSCDDSAVIELNESESYLTENVQSKCSSLNESNINATENSSYAVDDEPKISKATPLEDLPNIGDHIVFKVFLSNDKISENFIGKCEYINKRTKTIKLQIIEGQSQIRYLPQKYAGNIDDSADLKILNIKLQDMIVPKLLQME